MEDSEVARLIAETLRTYTASLASRGGTTATTATKTEEEYDQGGDEDSSAAAHGRDKEGTGGGGGGGGGGESLSYKIDDWEALSIHSDVLDAASVVPGITRLKDAIGIIPNSDKAAFVDACCHCPALVRLESHPRIFLLRHDYNVTEAARGLVQYWAMRRQIFGKRAFLPLNMTGRGALDAEDIQAIRSGFLMILPPDRLGRPVLLTDFSKVGGISDAVLLRTSFFIRCVLACSNDNASTKGYVGIEMYSKELNRLLEQPVAKTLAKMLEDAIPTFVKMNYVVKLQKWTFFHLLQSSPDLTDGLWKHMTPVVANSVDQLRAKLQKLHFELANIPEILGGSWSTDNFDAWLLDQQAVAPNESVAIVSPVPQSISVSSGENEPPQIDTDAIRDVMSAIEFIPASKKTAYLEAMSTCPFLVRTESNPLHFLRCESNDAGAAAHRLVRYWESRKTFFKQRAFRPLTFQKGGVFTERERDRLTEFYSVRVLPNDQRDRPVLWWDASSTKGRALTWEEKMKYWFYMFSVMCERAGAQESGMLFVAIPMLNVGVPVSSKLLRHTLLTSFPVKDGETRCCFTLEDRSILSYMTHVVNTMLRNPKVHVTPSKEEMCEELISVGLRREGIPIEYGGLWGREQDRAWRRERNRIEADRHAAWEFQPIADAVLPKPKEAQQDDSLFLETNFTDAMKGAIAALPESEKIPLTTALEVCPDVVRTESDPWKYLAVENGNLRQAARRTARYWMLRQEILGDHAFTPQIKNLDSMYWQSGAARNNQSSSEERSLLLLPGRDYYGRHVLFADNVGDYSTNRWRREAFFALAPLCLVEESKTTDTVLIFRTCQGVPLSANLQHAIEFINRAFPLGISNLLVGVVTGSPDPMSDPSEASPVQIEIQSELDKKLVDLAVVQSASSNHELVDILNQVHGFTLESLALLVAKDTESENVVQKKDRKRKAFDRVDETVSAKRSAIATQATACISSESTAENHIILLEEATQRLSVSERSGYEKAKTKAPNLVQLESDPKLFLTFEKNDPYMAARRLTSYWKQRTESFKDRALRPLNQTGEGALARKDVARMSSGYLVMLPNDDEGKAVLLHDCSRLTKKDVVSDIRNIFYWAVVLMQNEATVEKGVVLIIILKGDSITPETTRLFELTHRCFPFRFHSVHVISPGLARGAVDTLFHRMLSLPGTQKTKKEIHTADDTLAKLRAYGFSSENLPTSVGGSWSYENFAIWQEQRIRQEWELPLGAVEDESLTYKAKAFSQLTEAERAERKRRFNVLHSRRKRQRDRLEQFQLEGQVEQLRLEQKNLIAESLRLEGLLTEANAIIEDL